MARHPRVSRHTETLSDTVFGQLMKKVRGRAHELYPLHVGDTWLEPPPEARAEAQRTDEHPRLHNYAPVQGEPDLLDAVIDHVKARTGARLEREAVQVMPGATAGLGVVTSTILEPGDEVLLPAPYWPLIRGIIAVRGATPVEVPFFDRLDDPAFDPERALEAAVTERTTALYINTPHNPTGRVLSRDVLDAMARVAARHDLWVLSDEAYEELSFSDEPAEPAWLHPQLRDRAIVCHTLSKSFGLAGARVGWTHGPADVMRAVRGVQTFQTYCAARPMQRAAVGALRHGGPWLTEARNLYHGAGRAAAEALGISAPEGGTFLFFDASPFLPAGATDCMPFLERAVEAGVLLTPGASCGKDYAPWVRLCFTSVPRADLDRALACLRPLVAG